MNNFAHVPPGFRFHPTEEELVDYYLRKKIMSRKIDLDIIKDVDLYKIEPWDLQELCRIGAEEQNEWYFFSHKDKKYPTGTRTNRATSAGFWKATGRDKAIYSKLDLVGMRKTLVFYQGRAPHGQKSDWIMHEYRLETDENGTPQEEGWVVCRVFKKRISTVHKMNEHYGSPSWYDDQVSFMPNLDSPKQNSHSNLSYNHFPYTCKKELDLHYQIPHHQFLQLPPLESPKFLVDINHAISQDDQNLVPIYGNYYSEQVVVDQETDWQVLDKFVASQLDQEDVITKENNVFRGSDHTNAVVKHSNKEELMLENCSSSSLGCQISLWK